MGVLWLTSEPRRGASPLARGVHAILAEIYPHIEAVQSRANVPGRSNILLAASHRPLAPLDTLPEESRKALKAIQRRLVEIMA